ncbi:glycoside hydrolase family protein [Paraburkholderia xenovorans]|uniref:glycoside hydrolase family protein n=1 Tax=Paraburkholderia xenovorans TaxID=36873 RepID=UPI0038B70E39
MIDPSHYIESILSLRQPNMTLTAFKAKTRCLSLLLTFSASLGIASCGGSGGNSSDTTPSSANAKGANVSNLPAAAPAASSAPNPILAKNSKRGIAFDLASPADFAAVASGVSWWYNWGSAPNAAVPADYRTRYGMDFLPMLWNGSFNTNDIIAYLTANPSIKYMLVLNEPNLTDQSDMTPSQAAALWPQYEYIAAQTGVKIVGPAMNWGTLPGYEDPVVWLDEFYADYRAANGNRDPQIDYLAFHWYDYGLASQLDRLDKYGKQIWVTEFANWHSQLDGAQVDTLAAQEAQMQDMVATCESRSDVFRYAWFTGRLSPDPHYTSLLAADGQLTALGAEYLSLPGGQ